VEGVLDFFILQDEHYTYIVVKYKINLHETGQKSSQKIRLATCFLNSYKYILYIPTTYICMYIVYVSVFISTQKI
jgi:hypothetical protein